MVLLWFACWIVWVNLLVQRFDPRMAGMGTLYACVELWLSIAVSSTLTLAGTSGLPVGGFAVEGSRGYCGCFNCVAWACF